MDICKSETDVREIYLRRATSKSPDSLEIDEMSNLRKMSVKTSFENFSLGFYYLDEELEIQ
jgi:hypothetical protein